MDAQIGIIGLAVMGQNLALNFADEGYAVAVYNRTTAKTEAFVADRVDDLPVQGHEHLTDLVAALATPRTSC